MPSDFFVPFVGAIQKVNCPVGAREATEGVRIPRRTYLDIVGDGLRAVPFAIFIPYQIGS